MLLRRNEVRRMKTFFVTLAAVGAILFVAAATLFVVAAIHDIRMAP
jgi:hypothetical protein